MKDNTIYWFIGTVIAVALIIGYITATDGNPMTGYGHKTSNEAVSDYYKANPK